MHSAMMEQPENPAPYRVTIQASLIMPGRGDYGEQTSVQAQTFGEGETAAAAFADATERLGRTLRVEPG